MSPQVSQARAQSQTYGALLLYNVAKFKDHDWSFIACRKLQTPYNCCLIYNLECHENCRVQIQDNYNKLIILNFCFFINRSLEKFRVEYEKLHKALKKSHESEKRLMQKCRELNAEIVSNSAKVSTALKLSQEDQTTIAQLKKVRV